MNELEKALLNQFFYGVRDTNYPPYNIVKDGNDYTIEYAVAGFSKDELDIDFDGKSITVSGKKKKTTESVEFVHHGISAKDFKHTIAIRGTFDIGDVFLNNGILHIGLKDKTERIKPEIKIGDIPTYTQELLTE